MNKIKKRKSVEKAIRMIRMISDEAGIPNYGIKFSCCHHCSGGSDNWFKLAIGNLGM